MKDEPPPRSRTQVQAAPPVIHHYDEDETLLAQWLRRGYEKGAKFWLLVGGVVAAVALLSIVVGGLSAGKSVAQETWAELMLAKNTDDQVRIAESQPETAAAPWALLQAAEGRYAEGVGHLPSDREAAGPLLNRAYELFGQAYRDAKPEIELGDLLKRLAALGMGRALEARNELDKAREQYRSVAKQWPDTPEGRQAAALAERLDRPEAAEFYKKLYAFKPREVNLPPGGSSTLDLPLGQPPLGGSLFPSTTGGLPPLPPLTRPTTPPRTGGGDFPGQVFENNPPPPRVRPPRVGGPRMGRSPPSRSAEAPAPRAARPCRPPSCRRPPPSSA